MNVLNQAHRERLSKAAQASRKRMATARRNRRDMVAQYVGSRWSDHGADEAVVLNQLAIFVDTMSRFLAAKAPRADFRTGVSSLRKAAVRAELNANTLSKEQKLGSLMQRAVVEALISVHAIVKVGIASGNNVQIGDETKDIGKPFAKLVDLDDWLQDMFCNEWEEQQFRGDLFYPRLDVLAENKTFSRGVLAKLWKLGKDRDATMHGEGARTDTLGHGDQNVDEEFAERVPLWALELPHERQVCLFAASPDGILLPDEKPLHVMDWEGPDDGQYQRLIFRDVPGSTLGLPPAAQLIDLHDATNSILRRLIVSADQHKKVIVVDPKQKGTIEKIKTARTGDVVAGDASRIKEFETGGVNQLSTMLVLWFKSLVNYSAGNMDEIGGQGSQAGTLGQERLLMATASRAVQDMQERAEIFTSNVMRALVYWDWTDPVTDRKLTYARPGDKGGVEIRITAQEREQLDILNLNITIHPYSMQFSSPAQQLERLLGIWERAVVPIVPVIQQQGGTIDLPLFLSTIGDYADLPELQDIVQMGESANAPPSMERPTQSPTTTRHSVRTSVAKPENQEAQLLSKLMSSESSPQMAGE